MNGPDFAMGQKARRHRIEAYVLGFLLAIAPLVFLGLAFVEQVVSR